MKKEEIIRMARESGLADSKGVVHAFYQLQSFTNLVVKHVEEKCAKVCENERKSFMSKKYTTDPMGGYREVFAAEQCARSIRKGSNI